LDTQIIFYRQHNHELVGGAKATRGFKWKYAGIVAYIRTMKEGLQTEWRLKHSTNKRNIINKINSFLNYIDTNLKVSPKGEKLKYKLLFYFDKKLLNENIDLIIPKNVILINITLNDLIIKHIMTVDH